jgi:hypothetical protein
MWVLTVAVFVVIPEATVEAETGLGESRQKSKGRRRVIQKPAQRHIGDLIFRS